jgi:hypothetical protein
MERKLIISKPRIMAVWQLETDIDFTTFVFKLQEDELFFKNLVEDKFDNSLPIAAIWRPLYLIRDEPKKMPDFFDISNTGVIAVSEQALSKLESQINSGIEFLPLETDAGKFFAINVLKVIDCLDKERSKFTATQAGIIINYSFLEFDSEKINGNMIFKIPELPYTVLVTQDLQDICDEEYLQGLSFDSESNLLWYPE